MSSEKSDFGAQYDAAAKAAEDYFDYVPDEKLKSFEKLEESIKSQLQKHVEKTPSEMAQEWLDKQELIKEQQAADVHITNPCKEIFLAPSIGRPMRVSREQIESQDMSKGRLYDPEKVSLIPGQEYPVERVEQHEAEMQVSLSKRLDKLNAKKQLYTKAYGKMSSTDIGKHIEKLIKKYKKDFPDGGIRPKGEPICKNPCMEIPIGEPESVKEWVQDEVISILQPLGVEDILCSLLLKTIKKTTCPDCNGTGTYVGFNETETCSLCKGAKLV